MIWTLYTTHFSNLSLIWIFIYITFSMKTVPFSKVPAYEFDDVWNRVSVDESKHFRSSDVLSDRCSCSTYTVLASVCSDRPSLEQAVCVLLRLGAREDLDVYILHCICSGGEGSLSGNKRGKKNTPFSLYWISNILLEKIDPARSVCKPAEGGTHGERVGGQDKLSVPCLELVAMVTVNSISPTWNQLGVGRWRAFAGKWIQQREMGGGREIYGPQVWRLGMLRAPGAEGAWWDGRQREVVCIPKCPEGKKEREREKREGKSTSCRGGMWKLCFSTITMIQHTPWNIIKVTLY